MKPKIYTTCQDCKYCKVYDSPRYVCERCSSVNVANVDKNMDAKDESPFLDAT